MPVVGAGLTVFFSSSEEEDSLLELEAPSFFATSLAAVGLALATVAWVFCAVGFFTWGGLALSSEESELLELDSWALFCPGVLAVLLLFLGSSSDSDSLK